MLLVWRLLWSRGARDLAAMGKRTAKWGGRERAL